MEILHVYILETLAGNIYTTLLKYAMVDVTRVLNENCTVITFLYLFVCLQAYSFILQGLLQNLEN